MQTVQKFPDMIEERSPMRRSACPTNRVNARLLFLLLCMYAVSGCAGREVTRPEAGDHDKYYISGVPFFQLARQESSCGPSALAGIMSFWDAHVSMEQAIARVYIPELRGSLPRRIQRFLSEEGFLTVSAAGTISDLKAVVRRNVPVISLLDLGLGPDRSLHYVTVIGFDDAEAAFIVHDGVTANRSIEYRKFMDAWDRAGNWMLVAVPGASRERDPQ